MRGRRQLPAKESGIPLKQKEELSLKLQQFQSYERYYNYPGCIVIDAIVCQKEIVQLITLDYADYVITLNKNQDNLHHEVEKLFSQGISTGFQQTGIAQCLIPS